MDDKDRLLLSLLRGDARRPVVALARDLGLSRTATQDRLAKLQTSGAIKAFTIVEETNASRERAYLLINLEPGFRCAQLAPKLRAMAAVEAVHSVAGDVDLIVRLAAEHIDGIEMARAEIASLVEVAKTSTHVVLAGFAG